MRQERTVQATIFEVFAGHQIGCELKAISEWLDGHRALSAWWRRICGARACARPGDEACRRKRCCAVRF